MKKSLVFKSFMMVVTAAGLATFTPLWGDENVDLLNKAEDLVHQAWNPAGDPPSIEDRTKMLTDAMKLAQEAPDHHLKGHRVQAVLDIKAALAELQKGDPDHKATEFIHDADSELRTALSIAH
jgi:hypothetical protein